MLLFCLVLVYDFDCWRWKHDNVIIVIGVILIDLTNWVVAQGGPSGNKYLEIILQTFPKKVSWTARGFY